MMGPIRIFMVLAVVGAFIAGCSLSDSDDVMDLVNINIERTIVYHDPETDQDVTAEVKIFGKNATYSDSIGNSGTGQRDGETVTAQFSGPSYGTGTVTINFTDNFQHYSGTIQYDDGTVIEFAD